jgi:hypothetical protein
MAPLTSKESNMDNMEKLTHPVELFDEELDLVAAGDGSALVNVENIYIANHSLNDNNVAVGVLSIIGQR